MPCDSIAWFFRGSIVSLLYRSPLVNNQNVSPTVPKAGCYLSNAVVIQGPNTENPVSKLYRGSRLGRDRSAVGSGFGIDPFRTSSKSSDNMPPECPSQAQTGPLSGRLLIYPLHAYLWHRRFSVSLLCDILAVASVLAGSSGLADQILEDCAGNVCCGGTKVLVHFVGSVPRTGCTRNQGNLEPRMSHRWGRVGRRAVQFFHL